MKTNLRFGIISIFILVLFAVNVLATDVEITFLNQEPDPVEPGEYVELRYKVENKRSEDLYDVKIEFEPNYPFKFDTLEDRVKIIPKLSHEMEGKQAVTVKLRARIDENAVEGDYTVKILVSSSSYRGTTVHENQVAIKSREMSVIVESINVEPLKPKPGEIVAVNMILSNLAFSPLYDVSVKLNLAGTSLSPLGSTNEKIVKKISSKTQEDVKFNLIVDADAESRVHKIPLMIKFKDKFGDEHILESTLGIPVFAVPEYILNLEDSEVYVTQQKGKVVISLSNIGVGNLNFVTMELLSSENYEVLTTPKIYVGNLESDDYETVEFEIYSVKAVNEHIPLKIKLGFKDSYNQDYEEIIEVPLKIYSRREASKLGLVKSTSIVKPLIVLIILGIAGFVVYKKWWLKRKKK